MRRLMRAFVRGTVAAVVGGLLGAALTRLLMRAITLTVNGTPDFSWSGTMGIAIFHVVALLPGAIALAYSAGRWPWIVFGAGIAFLAQAVVMIGYVEAAAAIGGGLTPWRLAGFVTLLVAMAAVYSGQVLLVHWGARRFGHPRSTAVDAAR